MQTRSSFVLVASLGCCLACSAEQGDSDPGPTGLGASGGSQAVAGAPSNNMGGTTGNAGGANLGGAPSAGAMSTSETSNGGGTGATGGGASTSTSTSSGGTAAGGESSTEDSTGTAAGGATGTTTTDGETSAGNSGTGTGTAEGGYPEHRGAGCDVTAGPYGEDNEKLPNPFQMNDGTIISSMAEWECRRAEIIKDLEEYEVGPKPPPPDVDATYANGSLTVQVTTESGSMTLTSSLSGSGDCVIISMGLGGVVSGCRSMVFNHDQVVRNDHSSGDAWPDDPYYSVYPELYEEAPYGGDPISNGNLAIGNYSAWSWGVSRLIDGLEQTQEQHGLNLNKIGVQGCSYGGKMALWAGALDQRIMLTIAQESGGGGAPSWRTSEDFEQAGRGDVESIDDTNWAWFKDSLLNSREPHKLPHDHHELIALVAPRAFVLLPGDPTNNPWLGASSAYMSFMAAREVWKSMGVEDRAGIDVHEPGGAHCSASSRQRASAQAFVDKFLLDENVNTDIVNGLDEDWQSMVDWETPTIATP